MDAARSLAKVLVRLYGQEVEVAHDGSSALEAAQAFRPEIVLLDIGMPGMDGFEVARRLRGQQELSGTRLVALTGWGQAADRQKSKEAGFDVLPGVAAGEIAKAIKLEDLLKSEYWAQTRFYQPVDFLWQQTIFQPVGGMDMIARGFAREVGSLIRYGAKVTAIRQDEKGVTATYLDSKNGGATATVGGMPFTRRRPRS